jgi:penicillin-binding protein 2
MFRDIRKNKIFNRRTFLVSAAQGGLTATLLARLSYLQIFKHKEFTVQSNSNSIKPFIKPAPRGMIFDKNGVELTQNQENYRLYYYLEDKKNAAEIVRNLSQILFLSKAQTIEIEEKITKAKKRSMISLIDSLSWDDMARVEVNSYRLLGISTENEFLRRYPFPYETAHFLGYVSLPNEQEIDPNQKALYLHPSFRIGKTGLEKSYDEVLRGKYGVKYVEVNALERPLRTISVREAKEAPPLNLTIDSRLQKLALELMKKESGAITLMDVKTGEILAYVSSPSFDGNNFVEGISQKYWDELNNDKRVPLNNRPISAMYPPGSTFKLMTAIAALEAGLDPKKHYYCNGHFDLGRRRFHCWEEKGHGSLDMIGGIQKSCNVYFFNIANQIGIDKIAEVAARFGYGEKIEIGLQGVRTGNVPSQAWKEKVFGQKWTGGDTLNCSIGQGFVLSTPMQMALVTARIANGGVKIDPYLIKSQKALDQFDAKKGDRLVKKQHLDLILKGMNNVVNDPKGTSFYRRITHKGFEMAGKTGTSQVVSKRRDEMTNAERDLDSHKNHAIFVGFAPVHDPKYAISVVAEHGGSGSYTAAPIGRDMLYEVQKLAKS